MRSIEVMALGAAALFVGETMAFSAPSSLRSTVSLRTNAASVCGLRMQHAGKPIDRVDGFGGGFEAIQKVIDSRSKDDWGGGSGTGGASGKISDGPASFEEYMKKRAAASGGKVLDAGGNDVTDAKPSHKVGVGAWGAPKDMEKQEDPLAWVDKSVQGFQKQDTSDLMNSDAVKWKEEKAKKEADQRAAVEAKMQMWMKAAAEKKAKEEAAKKANEGK